MEEKLIYRTHRPIWHFLIAFALYLIGIALLFKSGDLLIGRKIKYGLQFFTASFLFLLSGMGLSFIKNVYADSKKKHSNSLHAFRNTDCTGF